MSAITKLLGCTNNAFNNLFTVTIYKGKKILIDNVRITNFVLPAIDIKTVPIKYQNTEYLIPSPGMTAEKKASFNVRIDSNFSEFFNIIENMNTSVEYDEYKGVYSSDMKIVVSVYENASLAVLPENYNAIMYAFQNCTFVNLPNINLDYSNTNPITEQVSFIYTSYDVLNNT